MKTTPGQKVTWLICAVVIAFYAWLTIAARQARSDDTPRPTRIDVLVIEHTPTGPVERTGYIGAAQLNGAAWLIDFSDDGDALFHNGFEPWPAPRRVP